MAKLLKGARVYTRNGFVPVDILSKDGVLRLSEAPIRDPEGAEVFDFSDKIILPGLVDVHVHLREPGFSYKATIASETSAAARGGFTAVCAMPNLNPVPDCRGNLDKELSIISSDAAVRVYPYGALTVGERGERIAGLEEIAASVVAFSDDGRGVQSAGVMREAMLRARTLGKIIAAHCEVEALLKGGYIHDGEYAAKFFHKGICSESEWAEVSRNAKLAKETGAKLHICHVSTKESVEIIRRAKRDGVDITAETCPHYLILTDNDLIEDGRFKMNPPLRAEEDRLALIEGIKDGTIDMIVTDHAPHSAEEKSRGLEKSLMGVVGLETSFPLLYTNLVKTGIITLEKLISLMHDAPLARFGIGFDLEDGAPTDLTVFDLNAQYTIRSSDFLSSGKATPFEGERVFGKCLLTLCGGRTVYKV